jgi:hypothetical protein
MMFHIYLFTFLIILVFFIANKLISDKRKVRLNASIERISLSFMKPSLILPEIIVKYKYYFGKGVYFGSDYLLLKDFLPNLDYQTGFADTGLPFISIGDETYVSEEHIETFLLNQFDHISVLVDPKQPYISSIEPFYSTQETISQKEI